MSTRKPPRLLASGLTGRAYIVTAYTIAASGHIVARTKHDATADLAVILRDAKADAWDEGAEFMAAQEGIAPDRDLNPYRTGDAA